jgi:hypothetical protein
MLLLSLILEFIFTVFQKKDYVLMVFATSIGVTVRESWNCESDKDEARTQAYNSRKS